MKADARPALRRPRFLPSLAASRGAKDPARVSRALAKLHASFPDAACALLHRDPFQLLVATILSAQCTDARVNAVTPALFSRLPGPAGMASVKRAELEELIHSTGFFRNKAKSIQGMARALLERHGGRVPEDLDALTALPGVGRKTANVVRASAFGRQAVVVDTHVSRLARRLGWTRSDDPARIERELMEILPESEWTFAGNALILLGRSACRSQSPRCAACPLGKDLCPSFRAAGAKDS